MLLYLVSCGPVILLGILLLIIKVEIVKILHTIVTVIISLPLLRLSNFLNLESVKQLPLLNDVIRGIIEEVVQNDVFEFKALAFVNCQA